MRRSWIIAVPVIALLLWSVVYPNAAVIAGSFENGLGTGASSGRVRRITKR